MESNLLVVEPIEQTPEQTPQNSCLDCGKPCSARAPRCRSCGNKFAWGKRQRLQPKFCADCRKPISPYADRCHSCATRHLWNAGSYPAGISVKGDKAPFWQGGIHHTAGKYNRVMQPEHAQADRNGFIMEHILEWEKAHGVPLPRGWVVHHLNGIKRDNNPGNLLALPRRKQKLLLQAKAKRIQELESRLNNQN